MSDIVERLKGQIQKDGDAYWEELYQQRKDASDEIERLRAIVRVNGLRWGHTHAEIDALLAPADRSDAEKTGASQSE